MHSLRGESIFHLPRRSRTLSADVLGIYLGLIDFVLVLVPAMAIYALYVGWEMRSSAYLATAAVTSTGIVTAFYLLDLYRLDAIARPAHHLRRLLTAVSVAFLLLIAFLFAFKVSADLSRVWVFSWFAVSTAMLLGGRFVFASFLVKSARAGKLSCNIIILGGGDHGRRLIRHMASLDEPWNNIVGVFDDRTDRVERNIEGYPVLGNLDDLVTFARNNHCDEILVALPWSAEGRVSSIIDKLRELPVHVSLGPDLAGLKYLPTNFRECAGVPVLEVIRKPIAGREALIKRVEDCVVGGAITLCALPVMLIIALLIKLDSRGPVFFKQRRYGFNNKLVEIYKFRTMKVDQLDHNGSKLTSKNDPRVTRIGKFLRRSSLDELPQFFNVLKGEMSVVGPRPHATEAKAGDRLYQDVVAEYAARHRVKPGITGWAQINGWRGETDNDVQILERVRHDMWYIDNWSLALDIKIILRTVTTVIGGHNAV